MQVMQGKHFGVDAEAAKVLVLVLGSQLVAEFDPVGMTDGSSSSL